VNALREIVSSGTLPALVASAISGLCALQDEDATPIIKKAFADKRVDEYIICEEDAEGEMKEPDFEYTYFNACRSPLELFGSWDFDNE